MLAEKALPLYVRPDELQEQGVPWGDAWIDVFRDRETRNWYKVPTFYTPTDQYGSVGIAIMDAYGLSPDRGLELWIHWDHLEVRYSAWWEYHHGWEPGWSVPSNAVIQEVSVILDRHLGASK